MRTVITLAALLPCLALGAAAARCEEAVAVNVANFVRAESDTMIRANMSMMGVKIGEFVHQSNAFLRLMYQYFTIHTFDLATLRFHDLIEINRV